MSLGSKEQLTVNISSGLQRMVVFLTLESLALQKPPSSTFILSPAHVAQGLGSIRCPPSRTNGQILPIRNHAGIFRIHLRSMASLAGRILPCNAWFRLSLLMD